MKIALSTLITSILLTSCIFGTGENNSKDNNTNDTISQDSMVHLMPWEKKYTIKYFDGVIGSEQVSLLLDMRDSTFRGRILFHKSKKNYLIDGAFFNNYDSLSFTNADERKFSVNFNLILKGNTYNGRYSKAKNKIFTLTERTIIDDEIRYFVDNQNIEDLILKNNTVTLGPESDFNTKHNEFSLYTKNKIQQDAEEAEISTKWKTVGISMFFEEDATIINEYSYISTNPVAEFGSKVEDDKVKHSTVGTFKTKYITKDTTIENTIDINMQDYTCRIYPFKEYLILGIEFGGVRGFQKFDQSILYKWDDKNKLYTKRK